MYPCHCVLDRVLCTTLTFWLNIYWRLSFSQASSKKINKVLEGLIIRKLYILKPKRAPCIYYALNESEIWSSIYDVCFGGIYIFPRSNAATAEVKEKHHKSN